MVDWDAGSYETTAAIEMAPVGDIVVDAAGIAADENVIDVASGAGNAALVAASVFGVIFATDPTGALREIRRVLRPSGRVFVSAWVPEGPVDAMLGAVGGIVARITDGRPAPRFAWSDPAVLGPVAAEAGLVLETTTIHELPIRATSAEAYLDLNSRHPMAVAVSPMVRSAGAEDELRAAQLSVLRDANEDPDGFLVHSPYVIHRLAAAPAAGH